MIMSETKFDKIPKANGQKKRRKPRNGRRSSQGRPKETEINVEDSKINWADKPKVLSGDGNGANAYTWYFNNPDMARTYADIAYNQVTGLPFDPYTHNNYTGNTVGDATERVIPGVMTFRLAPTMGIANSATDAINTAAQQLYTLVRKANSGRVNYDRTDLMMPVAAMDSAYMLYEELSRAYKLLENYKTMNRYMPNFLLQAIGFSPALANNIKEFKGALEVFAYRLGSINVPDQFDFITRHSWLYSNVYKDADNVRAQMYAYVPDGFFVYTEGTEARPTYLKYTTREALYGMRDTDATVSNMSMIWNAIDTIMNPILGSEDIGIITGDLEKAFGDNMIKISTINTGEALEVVYNEEVIQQMMNTTILPKITFNDVTVEYSNLTTGPYFVSTPRVQATTGSKLTCSRKSLLNMGISSDPTPEMNMVATRLMVTTANFAGPSNDLPITSCGTEICVGCRIWNGQVNNIGVLTGVNYLNVTGDLVFDQSLLIYDSEYIQLTSEISKFDWHPTIYVWVQDDPSQFSMRGYVQDVNVSVWLDPSTVSNMNTVAVISEFTVKDYKSQMA